jgi:hypothetical protein
MVQVLRPSQVTNVSALVGDGTIIAIGGHNGRATDKMLANIALQKAAGLVPALDCNAFDLPAAQLQTAKEKVRILVCAQASSLDQKSKKKDALATFAAAGLAPTAITVANGLVDAQFPFHEYDMIYFAGGDQNRLKRMFSASNFEQAHDRRRCLASRWHLLTAGGADEGRVRFLRVHANRHAPVSVPQICQTYGSTCS